MAQENPLNFDMNSILSTWMKMSDDSWGDMNKLFTNFSDPKRDSTRGQRTSRSQDSLESILKTWRLVSSAMNRPDSLNANLSGIGELPTILMKLAQTSVEGIARFQNRVQDKMSQAADHKGLFDIDSFDESFFNDWRQLYEQEIRQYLNIPQFGLMRFYQEKFGKVVDKHQILQAAMGEFMFILFKPIEASMKTLQDQMAEQPDGEAWSGTAKETYQKWIAILETDYYELLKSPEYLSVQGKVLNAMTDFSNIKDEIVQDLASGLPFPGRKEMDELYKELYQLRKRVRDLEKKNPDQ